MASVTVFYGLYGSGKSELAMNYAVELAKSGRATTIVDLDAVTPYFRIRDTREALEALGVHVLAPHHRISKADLPVLPDGVRRILRNPPTDIVVDLGGDPTGARVMGGLRDTLPQGATGLFVVNAYRPFTKTVDQAAEAVSKIATASGLSPGGIVSNTHLAEKTKVEDIVFGIGFARDLGARLGLPVVLVGIPQWLHETFERSPEMLSGIRPIYVRRFFTKPWEEEE